MPPEVPPPRPASRLVRLRPVLLALLALAGVVVAWRLLGKGGAASVPATQDVRGTWQGTFEAAMAALAEQDRAALLEVLTPVGRAALDADLTRFAEGLADPVRGPWLLERIRARWPQVPEALITSARQGRLDDVWTLFMRAATPAGVRPAQAGMLFDPNQTESVDALFRYGDGPEWPIRLVRVQRRWSVDRITLGSP